MKVLSLNTQKGYRAADLGNFLKTAINSAEYDFILLQEVDEFVATLLDGYEQYKILGGYDHEVKEAGHLRIMYRASFDLKSHTLHAFSKMHPNIMLQKPFGILLGTFLTPAGLIRVGSLHLHPGIKASVRTKEVLRIREILLADEMIGTRTIIGGDFNLGFPGEVGRTYSQLVPEFLSVTRTIGPTLDSRFSEPHENITNKVANLLCRFGLGILLRTDHIFVDADTAQLPGHKVFTLEERVSDHCPIAMELNSL